MSKRITHKGLVGMTLFLLLGLGVAARRSAAVPVPLMIAGGTPSDAMAAAVGVNRNVNIESLPPEDVAVRLENVNGGDGLTLHITPGGYVRPEEDAALKDFFRCRRTGKQKPLAPGVLSMLVDVATRWPGHVVEIVSGFRAPPYGAPHSRHFRGFAIDLRVRGVRITELRDYLWREHHGVGVGYYAEENFVHMDWRPEDKDTAWSEIYEGTQPTYNPGWAWNARHPRPHHHHAAVRQLALR
jgi:uncharacterized protein YcbK (DUF882 family)